MHNFPGKKNKTKTVPDLSRRRETAYDRGDDAHRLLNWDVNCRVSYYVGVENETLVF